jgi:hypothetical protein
LIFYLFWNLQLHYWFSIFVSRCDWDVDWCW